MTVILNQESRANFFNFSGGAITGTVWNDLNADGLRAVEPLGAFTEPGLAGWQVYLDLNNNLSFDPSEPSTITMRMVFTGSRTLPLVIMRLSRFLLQVGRVSNF